MSSSSSSVDDDASDDADFLDHNNVLRNSVLRNPNVWYNTAQEWIQDEMSDIASLAASVAGEDDDDDDDDDDMDANGGGEEPTTGIVDASVLSTEKVELLQLYLEHQKQWQQVSLVIEHDSRLGLSTCLVLNRPMARFIDGAQVERWSIALPGRLEGRVS